MSRLQNAIDSILSDCLKISRREKLLILADEPLREIAWEFYTRARIFAPLSSFIILPELSGNNCEPPKSVSLLLNSSEVALLITSRSLSHTKARKKACLSGTRIASLPGVTRETLQRTLNGQYKAMINMARKIADILTIGKTAHLTTPSGTDLTFSLARMRGYSDTGMVHESGQFSNLPAGEACIAPVPGTAQGILVVDGSFPELGLLENPVRMRIRDGYVIRITGEKEALHIRRLLRPYGKLGRHISELGIGTNPHARLCGLTLEDEKTLGTVHIALGNNVSFGGKVAVRCHYDAVLRSPTLSIDRKSILFNGELQV
jgi:leucyl aminopeptidase (aminopeptidase T)